MVFPADTKWRDWVMLLLGQASKHWGGAGFILVPFDPTTGQPDPEFAPIVRSYDPDHVLALDLPFSMFEEWYPKRIRFANEPDEAKRKELILNAHMEYRDRFAHFARDRVASWCSPLRMSRYGTKEGQPLEVTRSLSLREPDRYTMREITPAPPRDGTAWLAASPGWRSDLGLLAAMRVGVTDAQTDARPEPGSETIGWLIRPIGNRRPQSLIWNADEHSAPDPNDLQTWFESGQDLIQTSRGHTRDAIITVVGDTAKDFALALAYDRTFARGVWVPKALVKDRDTFRGWIRPALQTSVYDVERSADFLVITSSSENDQTLQTLADDIRQLDMGLTINGEPIDLVGRDDTVQVRKPNSGRRSLTLLVNERIIAPSINLPVESTGDGSKIAVTGIETSMPTNLIFDEASGQVPYWFVDVSINRLYTPAGRDLPSDALAVDDGPLPEVNIRSSKDGFSFSPSSMGFVSSGALFTSRIGRPRLKILSMRAWVEARAERAGLRVKLSSAGRRAHLLGSRLGGREALIELMKPDVVRLLRGFAPLGRAQVPDERDTERFVPNRDPFLTFAAMQRFVADQARLTEIVDRLATSRLLRRGMALGCQECGRASFVGIDSIGREFECPQCGTLNALVADRWRDGSGEPRWFYDLHPTAREMLKENGEVPLLAADRLRTKARRYADTAELLFWDGDHPFAEIDLIANADDELLVVEAKSASGYGTQKQARQQVAKLSRVADVLQADRLVLATTQSAWDASDVALAESAAARAQPTPLAVDVLTDLGSST